MSRVALQDTITSPSTGIAAPGATVTIRENNGLGALATVYADSTGTIEANNPIDAGDAGFGADGFLDVWLETGLYYVEVDTGGVTRGYSFPALGAGANLIALDDLAGGANQLPYFTGADSMGQTPLTAYTRTLLDNADVFEALETLTLQATPAAAFDAVPADDTTYLYGPDFVNDGDVPYNFPNDDYQRVIGQEYLSAFQQRIVDSDAAWLLEVWGDSRFAGNSQTGNYILHDNLKWRAREAGYRGGEFVNNASGGTTLAQWEGTLVDTYLDGTADPHVVVFCAGINDLRTGGGPGWTPAQVVAEMDAFLTKVRVTKGYTLADLSMAIVLPLSAYKTSDNRDMRQVIPMLDGFKRLARKHQVCFIDGFGVAADASNQRGLGFSTDQTAPEVLHQNNTGMLPIFDLIANTLFPPSGGLQGRFYTDSGTSETFDADQLPADYPIGESLLRAQNPGGGVTDWPVAGFVQTLNYPDDIQVQFNYATSSADDTIWVRKGRAGAWGDWNGIVGAVSEAVTPGVGYSLGAAPMTARKQGKLTTVDGFVELDTPGTIAENTVIATLPDGYRPSAILFAVPMGAFDGSGWEYIRCRIRTNGQIINEVAVTLTATRIYLGAPSWVSA